MIRQTGETYESSKYAKMMAAGVTKMGKTAFLTGSLLGVMPWQKRGGVVSDPKNLHIFAFDSNAFGGVRRFLVDTCKAPVAAVKTVDVFNFQDDARRVSMSTSDYDMSLYNTLMAALDEVNDAAAKGGIHALLISSLTGVAQALERAVVGPPGGAGGDNKGYADPSKWKMFAHQLGELRNFAQVDNWHTIWEAHVDKPPTLQMGKESEGAPPPKETIHVSGQAGRNFAYNVEQVVKVGRLYGDTIPGTACDKMFLDTRPALDFIASGRGFTEALAPKEPDMTVAFEKLGLSVGHWTAKGAAK